MTFGSAELRLVAFTLIALPVNGQTFDLYTGLTQGSCGSDYAITTLSQCGTAAQRLNKWDTTASNDGQTSVWYDPPYCYYEGGSLKLNSGGNTGSCTVQDECLCTKPSSLGTGVTCASNTCHYPSDGDCDDGGPNSDYSACPRGTDFTDCGYRCDMRCDPSGSSCALRGNNVCDDGGPGSEFSSCPFGSDCEDCGLRFTSSLLSSPPPSPPPQQHPPPPPGAWPMLPSPSPPPPLPPPYPSGPPEAAAPSIPPLAPAAPPPALSITAFQREATESLVYTLGARA